MPFNDLIAQRRRKMMMQNQVSNTEPPQSDYRRETGLNRPAEPEMVNRPPDVDRSGQYREEIQAIRGKTPMTDQYRQMLGQTPAREDYRPGKLDRLTASLGGVSAGLRGGADAGVNTARGILDTDYHRALEDHNRNLEGAGSGAALERQDIGDRVTDYRSSLERQDISDTRLDTRFNDDRANANSRFGATTSRLDTENRGDYYNQLDQNDADRIAQRTREFDYGVEQNKAEEQRAKMDSALSTIDPDAIPPGHYGTQDLERARAQAINIVAFSPEFREFWNLDLEEPIPLDDVPDEVYWRMMQAVKLHESDFLDKAYGGY